MTARGIHAYIGILIYMALIDFLEIHDYTVDDLS
jgi:hypothetical protein